MNIRRILGGAALCGVLLLCVTLGGCSGDKPKTYACKYTGLGEAGLECAPHKISPQLSVYRSGRNGNDIVGVVALPPALFSSGSYAAKEAGGRLHLFREAGQMFVDVGCYGGSTSTVTVDNEDWQVTECSLGTYVQGNIFGKGDFGVYLRQGAPVSKSIEQVVVLVRSRGSPRLAM